MVKKLEDKKLKFFGWTIYYSAQVAILIFLVKYLYFDKWSIMNWIEMSSLIRDMNFEVGQSLLGIILFSIVGIGTIFCLFADIIEDLLKPKTQEELNNNRIYKSFMDKYPRKIARLKRREFRQMLKVKEIQDKIKKEEKKIKSNK